ncbi:MAG: sporulation integral membrane protein YtvI [Clostridia bacterium]|nr:sporulation integral membrane protein YtvI [Clostridia bacterium]
MNREILKKIFILVALLAGTIIALKLAIFYMPFIIAFALYLLIEPAIKFFMKKFKLKRKTSSVLILIVAISIIIGIIVWGVVTIISESSNLLKNLNEYVNIIYEFIRTKLSKIDFTKLQISEDLKMIFESSTQDVLLKLSDIVKRFFSNVLLKLTSIPTMAFYIVITITALYFICTDKIYMIDQLEHHLPQNWVKKIYKHIHGIANALGKYLKAQTILVVISFAISLIGLLIYSLIGFNIKYPLLVALGIGFVDALPILGSGAVMVPWAIIEACKGDVRFGIAILILWIIMTVSRQIIEPKVVGGQLGIHPIFTIISMYTGVKFCGLIGLFVGPIILIILKNIFENTIDKGIFNFIKESDS